MDTSNDNIHKLFDMLDNPGAYSEQEISDIINFDEETQETYRLMVEAKRSSRWAQPEQPADVDAAWRRFEKRAFRERNVFLTFRKIAAIFLAVVFICGLAWAIGAPFLTSSKGEDPQPAQATSNPLPLGGGREGAAVRFSNIRLDSILSVVSSHYGKAVSFRSDEAKAKKFIMMWVPDSSLTSFIDGLNMFDGLQLTLLRDTIFVETTEAKEDAE